MTFANAILRHDPLLIEPRLLTAFVERCGGFTDVLKELFGEPPQARIVSVRKMTSLSLGNR